jgi:DNA mismatch repair protein MutL
MDKLLPLENAASGHRVHGFAGRPAEALSRRDNQHYFVNGRAVQDRMLSHAVIQGYANTMPKGRYPALFLFVEIDPALVDVNVHPRKTEVRFRTSGQVHDMVRDALAGALSGGAVVPDLGDLRPRPEQPADDLAGPRRAALRYLETAERQPDLPRYRSPAAPGPPKKLVEAMEAAEDGAPASRVSPLAQYRDSYIVAQDDEGLLLVDQHAAHERILFERYLAAAEENRVDVQKLLFPVTVELTPAEVVLVEREADEFRRLGFLVEPFGGNTVRLDAIPAVAGDGDPALLLRELLGEASRAHSAAADVAELRLRLVTTAACKAAVKVNDPLNRESMQRLLDDLFATSSPSTCPHGRPLLFRLPLDEIERAFCRR